MTRSRFAAFALAALLAAPGLAQVTTDYTKTGIPNGTPTAISASTGTGSTMVLQTSPTLSTPTLNTATLVTPTSSNGTFNTPTLSIPKLSTQTWANLPAAASNSWAVTVASDLGTNGTLVASNGTRWRPVNGAATLTEVSTALSAIANTETVACQALIPAGAWQAGDILRIYEGFNKSGAVDSLNRIIRIGTAGTTADTTVTGTSGSILVAANLSGAVVDEVKLESATSARKVGAGASGGQSYSIQNNAEAAATTISSAATNALYVSVTIASSGATNTVGLRSCHIQLITP